MCCDGMCTFCRQCSQKWPNCKVCHNSSSSALLPTAEPRGKCEFMIIPCPSLQRANPLQRTGAPQRARVPGRGRSTANTARSHFTSKTSRLEIIYLDLRRSCHVWVHHSSYFFFFSFSRHMMRSVPSTRWSVKAAPRRKYPERRWVISVKLM